MSINNDDDKPMGYSLAAKEKYRENPISTSKLKLIKISFGKSVAVIIQDSMLLYIH